VRFTSLFYNFVWIWGSNERNRNLFTDWASYDFTVCPEALDDFAKEYGYVLCAEDFVRGGRYFATHRVPDQKKRDWMEFIGKFVRRAGRDLIDTVHDAGKLAYVFYDDNWVGLEPYNGHFAEFGFDGLVKCVFSGYEARLCAGVPIETHEIRFHPYLFPVGLGGLPTFAPGGEPCRDALTYWINVRRALLREHIERCGLGGYLSLTDGFPMFLEAMDIILDEFRRISVLHDGGAPVSLTPRVAILHAWGKLRTWTLSGHFHETPDHVLIHVLESLSGLPFDVEFISFDDISDGVSDGIDVIINAGAAGDAWSGGICWRDTKVVDSLTKWVNGGGAYIGIGEPSALEGGFRFLRMAHVLGIDIDNGEYTCHGRWGYNVDELPGLIPDGVNLLRKNNVMLTDGNARVLAESDGNIMLTINNFGKGTGLYCTGFIHTHAAPRLLQNLILFASKSSLHPEYTTDDALVEAAYYPDSGKLALINNSQLARMTSCTAGGIKHTVELKPFELKILEL
jgi:beta-D-galactosyl-(1->4)-L-rhamnose phosphorylase